MAGRHASIPREEYLAITAKAMPEKLLQQNVADLCKRLGALHYHTHNSRHSTAGFPDSIIITEDRRLIVAELKRQTESPTPKQLEWLEAFSALWAGKPAASVHVWRPMDWLDGTIEAVVTGAR